VLHEEEQEWEISDQGVFGLFAGAEVRRMAENAKADGFEITGSEVFKMIKCGGCDSVKLQHTSWAFESGNEFHPDGLSSVTYYPPPTSRPEPPWLTGFAIRSPEQQYVVGLLHEIYTALHNHSLRLATMGARALLEYIMVANVGDQGTFGKNLDAFQAHGHLSAKQREIVEPILEAGHAAIHRAFRPSIDDVDTVMTITESLVETTYVQSKMAAELKDRVPSRKRHDAKIDDLSNEVMEKQNGEAT